MSIDFRVIVKDALTCSGRWSFIGDADSLRCNDPAAAQARMCHVASTGIGAQGWLESAFVKPIENAFLQENAAIAEGMVRLNLDMF